MRAVHELDKGHMADQMVISGLAYDGDKWQQEIERAAEGLVEMPRLSAQVRRQKSESLSQSRRPARAQRQSGPTRCKTQQWDPDQPDTIPPGQPTQPMEGVTSPRDGALPNSIPPGQPSQPGAAGAGRRE